MNYNTKETIETYKVTKREAELAQFAYDHRNTYIGEAAFLTLSQSVLGRFGKLDILYDVGADFKFDCVPVLKDSFEVAWDKYWNAIS